MKTNKCCYHHPGLRANLSSEWLEIQQVFSGVVQSVSFRKLDLCDSLDLFCEGANFLLRGQTASILGQWATLSLTICQLCHCSTEAATGNPKTPGNVCVPVEIYLQKHVACHGPSSFAKPWSGGFLREVQESMYIVSLTFYQINDPRSTAGNKAY